MDNLFGYFSQLKKQAKTPALSNDIIEDNLDNASKTYGALLINKSKVKSKEECRNFRRDAVKRLLPVSIQERILTSCCDSPSVRKLVRLMENGGKPNVLLPTDILKIVNVLFSGNSNSLFFTNGNKKRLKHTLLSLNLLCDFNGKKWPTPR